MLGELIKEAARGCLREENLAEVAFGTIMAAEPLTVKVEDRLLLQGERLLLPEHLKKRSRILAFGEESQEIILSPGPEVGDKVILVRIGGYFLVQGVVS